MTGEYLEKMQMEIDLGIEPDPLTEKELDEMNEVMKALVEVHEDASTSQA